VTKVLTPSIKLVPLIKTNIQNKVKNSFIKKIFNKLSKKSILIESIKLSNKNRYITIMIIWNITLKVGVCKIFRSDNKPIKKIKKINIFKYLLSSGKKKLISNKKLNLLKEV